MVLAFEKRKSFIARSTSKETGGKAQISLPIQGWDKGVRDKGVRGISNLKADWLVLNQSI